MKLTEKKIQQIALGFLKSYYKYRPRKDDSPTVAAFDLNTKSGIVVDGYLAYVEPDGKEFMATMEATSKETEGEVRYKTQTSLLFWDAGALASLAAAFLFSYGYAYNHFTIKQIGLLASLGILLATFLGVIALHVAFFRFLTRYRYIYAVEQFKKYQANEQWIAIGEDVFGGVEEGFFVPNPRDKDFLELKKQCVSNGFGLVMIGLDGKPHMLITPARREVLDDRDKVLSYMRNNKLRETVRKSPFLEKCWARTKSVLGIHTKSNNARNYARFQRSFTNQLILGIIATTLVSTIFYQELKDADILYVDEKEYLNEMEELKINVRPEPIEEMYDSVAIVHHLPTKKRPQNSADQLEEAIVQNNKRTNRPQKTRKPPKKTAKTDVAPKNKPQIVKTDEVIIYTGKDFLNYDCARLVDQTGEKYVIVEGVYADAGLAKRRIRSLARENIPASAFWKGCYIANAKGYLVFIDAIFNDAAVAQKALGSYRKMLSDAAKKDAKLKLKSITF